MEHFLEVLLLARDRAAAEYETYRRTVWEATVRDIETILADDPSEIAEARDRLAQRNDAEGRRLHDCAAELLRTFDAANREAKEAIERARRG